jgi:hypothetical protein
MSAPHPFHCGPIEGSFIGGLEGQAFGKFFGLPASALPICRYPPMNSDMRRFCASVSPWSCSVRVGFETTA